MKNKLLTIATILFCSISFNCKAQDSNLPTKLIYTIQVDGLLNQAQATRLDDSFKRKVGILSDDINFETKTIIVKTSEEVTYLNVCDILSTEGLKAQSYIVNKE